MKKLKHLWILILLFGLVSMSACGKPEEEPPATPSERPVIVDIVEAMAANKILKQRNEELEGILKRSQEKQAEYATAIRTLEDANLALRIELALMKSLEENRSGGFEKLLNELAALKAEKKDWDNLSKLRYERILEQYNELAAHYPLKGFPDKETLVDWRYDAGNITEAKPLWVLQRLAADEGYLIVVGYNIPYGMTIVGGYWYKLLPEEKNLVEKLGKVE